MLRTLSLACFIVLSPLPACVSFLPRYRILRGRDAYTYTPAAQHSARSSPAPPARNSRDEFDVIVVGGGTAGCVLGERLSRADPSLRVLLLEPGPRPYRSLHVSAPAALTKLFQSKWDWKFTSQDEQHTSAGRGLYLCRGKALGGSSNTNALLYHRGSPADFAAWEAAGGPEWSAENLLPYFKRAEDFHPDAAVTAAAAAAPTPSGSAQPPAGVDARWHGVGGPVPVSTPPYQNPLSRGFLAACASLGFVANPDFNDWSRPQAGVGRFQVTAKRGKRFSAARAYLWESRNRFPLFGALRSRRSLRVRTGFRATRVLFHTPASDVSSSSSSSSSSGARPPQVIGVEYAREPARGGVEPWWRRQPRRRCVAALRAGGEVVLAAGALGSPQLLLLSGVGPQAELAAHGIAQVKRLEGVGRNLRDHPAVLASYNVAPPGASITDHLFAAGSGGRLRWATALAFGLRGKGALTSPGCDHGGFFRTTQTPPGAAGAVQGAPPGASSATVPSAVANAASAVASAVAAVAECDLQLRFVPGRGDGADGVANYASLGRAGHVQSGCTFQCVAIRPASHAAAASAAAAGGSDSSSSNNNSGSGSSGSSGGGSVRLSSSDPFALPAVTLNVLAAQTDVDVLVAGLRLSDAIAREGSLAQYAADAAAGASDSRSTEAASVSPWEPFRRVFSYRRDGAAHAPKAVATPLVRVYPNADDDGLPASLALARGTTHGRSDEVREAEEDADVTAKLEAYVRRTVHSANALVGTCAMGPEHAPGAGPSPPQPQLPPYAALSPWGGVVDHQLRVHGVKGLRVADASVFPTLPGGQTSSHVYAVAEKAADLILQARGRRVSADCSRARLPP